MNGFYPVFLQLKGKRCVIIGGGSIAQRKLLGLLDAGADQIWVISPSITPRMQSLAAEGQIYYIEREYCEGDLSGAWLVFAATSNKRLNKTIAADADHLRVLVNAVDDAGHGSFISPSVVRRGDLLLAVTASGASPALSKQIKQQLEAQYGSEYVEVTALLRRLREIVIGSLLEEQDRQAVLKLAAEEAPQLKRNNIDMDEWLRSLLHRIDRGLT